MGKVKDPGLRAAQPILCDHGGAPPSRYCEGKSYESCEHDVWCSPQYGSSHCYENGTKCLPDMVFKGCAPAGIGSGAVAHAILQHVECVSHGAVWTSLGGVREGGSCECRSDGGLLRYVQGRGCVEVSRLCAEASGTWIVPGGSPTFEILSRDECARRPNARWEPSPHPPVGMCEWPNAPKKFRCDGAMRSGLQQNGLLQKFTEEPGDWVLCTYDGKQGQTSLHYPYATPFDTRMYTAPFCRKDGRAFDRF